MIKRRTVIIDVTFTSGKTLRRGYYTNVMLVLWKLQFFNYYLTAKQKLNLNVNSL